MVLPFHSDSATVTCAFSGVTAAFASVFFLTSSNKLNTLKCKISKTYSKITIISVWYGDEWLTHKSFELFHRRFRIREFCDLIFDFASSSFWQIILQFRLEFIPISFGWFGDFTESFVISFTRKKIAGCDLQNIHRIRLIKS